MSQSQVQTAPYRIGAVSFLNTVPLICGLDDHDDVELIRDLPSRLADRLYEQQIDVGLVPIIEYLRGVGGDIVPGICLGADGPVHSVKVFSKVPLEEAESIAVDRGSRSSVALLRILLAELYDRHPDLHTVEPMPDDPFALHDTALIIGDRAIAVTDRSFHIYDLGLMWHELTDLPFVFAAWVLSPALSKPSSRERREGLIARLRQAKEAGQSNMEPLAREQARLHGRNATDILHYWKHSIRYDMGESELAGLERFAELSAKHNLCNGREAVSLAKA